MLDFTSLLTVSLLLHGVGSSVLPRDNGRNIISGVPVALGKYPFIVSVQRFTSGHVCGGILINLHTVLTAAHCIRLNPDQIVAGVVDLQTYLMKFKRPILETYIHPKFKSSSLYDIALIKVLFPFPLLPTLQPIRISDKAFNNRNSVEGTISGWGLTKEDDSSSYSSQLLEAHVRILSHEECYEEYGDDVDSGLLCALPYLHDEDACKGDSGGPLLCDGALVGVISSGAGCGNPYSPGIYVNVSQFAGWIKENM